MLWIPIKAGNSGELAVLVLFAVTSLPHMRICAGGCFLYGAAAALHVPGKWAIIKKYEIGRGERCVSGGNL